MPTDRVLIVDDDQGTLELLGLYMESFGFDYEKALDGLDAVEKLGKRKFTIVITDMAMPRMDGMELLKHIREHHPRIGVIVVTGRNSFSYTDVINAGASDFISKPFNIDELEAKLKRLARELNLIRQLEQHSVCDALTVLYNRRYFDNTILKEVQRAHRQQYEIFLLMLDVDNLKAFNDLRGHQGGDRLLQAVSRILLQSIRENVDWAFRYGGDEFGIVFNQVEKPQIVRATERILEKFSKEDFDGAGLSLGSARFIRRNGRTWQEDIDYLVARADRALYEAKNRGKNQVFFDEVTQDH